MVRNVSQMADDRAGAAWDDLPDLADYRRQARAWPAGHLEARDGPAREYGIDHFTPEVMAANRRLQRKLSDRGYAGITRPREYGGQGLPAEYEEAFLAEAAGFVTPDGSSGSRPTPATSASTLTASLAVRTI